jgi:hypothetical protein
MKKLITILCLTYLLSGCLYTKKRALEKFCTTDSIPYSIIVHDTIVIKAIKVDTFFNSSIDSFTIIKDRLEIRYKKVGEKIFIQGECKSDTIYKTKLVQVQVPTKVKKLEWWESLYIKARDWFAVIGFLAMFLGFYLIMPHKKSE